MNLLDLDIDLSNLGEVSAVDADIKVSQALYYKHTRMKDADFAKYQPLLAII